MDYIYIVLFLLVLVGALVLLSRLDARTKKRYKQDAYRLLETANADVKKLKDTIKGLRLYGGRFKKDKEAYQLIQKLQDKLEAGA
ncbi:MAG TPA: hypothetical protein VMB24_03025 [Dehalococcoidales bacterium]|nr:hypothetical protein [Dehalococcoidales bacterium]